MLLHLLPAKASDDTVPVDVILPELIPAAVTPPVMLAPAAVTVPTVVKPAPIVAPSVTAKASDEIVPADVKLPLKFRLLNARPPVTARLPPIDTLPVVVNAPALIPPPIVKPGASESFRLLISHRQQIHLYLLISHPLW